MVCSRFLLSFARVQLLGSRPPSHGSREAVLRRDGEGTPKTGTLGRLVKRVYVSSAREATAVEVATVVVPCLLFFTGHRRRYVLPRYLAACAECNADASLGDLGC